VDPVTASAAPSDSLRRRHVLRTREAIVRASLEAFAERGFAGTTVEDIARRADVASRTFFRHFPTKEAVLFHDSEEVLAGMRARLSSRPAGEEPHVSLLAACSAIADGLAADTDRMRLLVRLSQEEPKLLAYQRIMMLQHFEADIVVTLADRHGIDRSDVGLQATTAAILSALGVAFQCWIDGGATGSLAPVLAEAVAACHLAFSAGRSVRGRAAP
jgi:AcrR family transcriptional regulator